MRPLLFLVVVKIVGFELIADGENLTIGAVIGGNSNIDEATMVISWLFIRLQIVPFEILICDCLLFFLRFLESSR